MSGKGLAYESHLTTAHKKCSPCEAEEETDSEDEGCVCRPKKAKKPSCPEQSEKSSEKDIEKLINKKFEKLEEKLSKSED